MTNPSGPENKRQHRSALRPQTEKNLTAYALTGAAGLGIIFSPSAQAGIVYTPVETVGSPGSYSNIDLNQDGVTDFVLGDTFFKSGVYNQGASFFIEVPGSPDSVAVDAADQGLALTLSAEIGPKLRFEQEGFTFRLAQAAVTYSGVAYQDGSFLDQSRKFLGLKLVVDGEAHYGWARVSTKLESGKIYYKLLDYAYQTTANKPIYAGEGIPSSGATESLGSLAYGAK